MTRERELRPRGPYSLAQSAVLSSDACRRFRDGVLSAVVPGAAGGELVHAWQRPSGAIAIHGGSDAAVERLRFVLAVDDDHSEFLRRFRGDPLLGRATVELRGLRPLRLPTVAQALLRALCGQLIEARRARALEARLVRAATPVVADRLHAPPGRACLAARSPAELRRDGLHGRRGATLVRLCRSVELERLHAVPTAEAASWLSRERGLGPWSAGVVCLEGLGRREHGLVGDLGLVKLLAALRGRRVEAAETAELLEPYGEWAGLAGVYLLRAWSRGLLAVPRLRRAA